MLRAAIAQLDKNFHALVQKKKGMDAKHALKVHHTKLNAFLEAPLDEGVVDRLNPHDYDLLKSWFPLSLVEHHKNSKDVAVKLTWKEFELMQQTASTQLEPVTFIF